MKKKKKKKNSNSKNSKIKTNRKRIILISVETNQAIYIPKYQKKKLRRGRASIQRRVATEKSLNGITRNFFFVCLLKGTNQVWKIHAYFALIGLVKPINQG